MKPIIICGPTASGKSALALQLAQELSKRNGPAHASVIINADSQQIYKEIPILSAQPSDEDKRQIQHFLFGEIKGDEDWNVAIWLKKVKSAIKNHNSAIIVGGTGMYINALLYGLAKIPDIPEEIRNKIRALSKEELLNQLGGKADGNLSRMRRNLEVKRTTGKYIDEFHSQSTASTNFIILNMNVSRETIYDNINRRFLEMVKSGAIEEARSLNYPPTQPIMKAVGIREIKAYIAGESSLAEAVEKSQQRSRNYAKRQITWFRHQLPENKIDVASFEQAITLLK